MFEKCSLLIKMRLIFRCFMTRKKNFSTLQNFAREQQQVLVRASERERS